MGINDIVLFQDIVKIEKYELREGTLTYRHSNMCRIDTMIGLHEKASLLLWIKDKIFLVNFDLQISANQLNEPFSALPPDQEPNPHESEYRVFKRC